MTFFFIAVFLIAFAGGIRGRRADLFSPGRLFIIPYSIFLAIDSLKLSRLQSPWSATTQMLFWGSVGMLLAGILLSRIAANTLGAQPEREPSDIRACLEAEARTIDWHWYLQMAIVCAGIFIAGYIISYFVVGEIPIFTATPDASRLKFITANGITVMTWFFGPINLMMIFELLIMANPDEVNKPLALAIGITVLALYFSLVTRVDLFRACVFMAFFAHYAKKRIGFLQISFLGFIGILAFVVMAVLRMHAGAFQAINEALKVRMPSNMIWAAQIYGYVVSNFWNMDYGFSRYIDGSFFYPLSWGFETFKPVLFLTQLQSPLMMMFGFDGVYNESVNMVHGMNSALFVWHLYKDFGVVGLYASSLAIGFALGLFYQNTMRKPTLSRIGFWCIFAGMIPFSISTAFWQMWFIYMNLFMLYIAHRKRRSTDLLFSSQALKEAA